MLEFPKQGGGRLKYRGHQWLGMDTFSEIALSSVV